MHDEDPLAGFVCACAHMCLCMCVGQSHKESCSREALALLLWEGAHPDSWFLCRLHLPQTWGGAPCEFRPRRASQGPLCPIPNFGSRPDPRSVAGRAGQGVHWGEGGRWVLPVSSRLWVPAEGPIKLRDEFHGLETSMGGPRVGGL